MVFQRKIRALFHSILTPAQCLPFRRSGAVLKAEVWRWVILFLAHYLPVLSHSFPLPQTRINTSGVPTPGWHKFFLSNNLGSLEFWRRRKVGKRSEAGDKRSGYYVLLLSCSVSFSSLLVKMLLFNLRET